MPIFRGKQMVSANSDYKNSARVVQRTSLNLTVTVTIIDGVTLQNHDRVLLAGQAAPSQNGIYAWDSTTSKLSRATDADSTQEVASGVRVYVSEGTTGARSTWVMITPGTIVVGSTAQTWVKDGQVHQTDLSVLAVSGNTLINSTTGSTPNVITSMTLTPGTGTYLAMFNSQLSTKTLSSITATTAANLSTLYNSLMALQVTNTSHISTFGSGETLGPGIYDIAAAISILGTLTLDAGGNPSALFVFRCTGAFTTGAGTTIVLAGGATSSNIWWVSQGAASTAASTTFKGCILTNQAGVSTGANNNFEGRLLAITGANAIATTIMTAPTGTSVIPLGLIESFAMFSGIGAPSNSGVSTVWGSIGTNAGANTGFETATVYGTIYTAGTSTAEIILGVYVNGELIADSRRSQLQTAVFSGHPASLQTVVTVADGQAVDVRNHSPIGTFSIGPGMSFVLIPIS